MNTTVTQRHPALQPSKIGRFELTNRLVVAPMSRVSAAADGTPTDEMTDYYAQFASGVFRQLKRACKLSTAGAA